MISLQQWICLRLVHTYISLTKLCQSKPLFTKKNYLIFKNYETNAENDTRYAKGSPPPPLHSGKAGVSKPFTWHEDLSPVLSSHSCQMPSGEGTYEHEEWQAPNIGTWRMNECVLAWLALKPPSKHYSRPQNPFGSICVPASDVLNTGIWIVLRITRWKVFHV